MILPAAGSGQRFGGVQNKLFATLEHVPLWLFSVRRLRLHQRVGRILMPISASDRPRFETEFAQAVAESEVELVAGGKERTDSVRSGLEALGDDDSVALVAIHDAARPLVRHDHLDAVFAKADQCGAAILATPVTSTVKQSFDDGHSCHTLDRKTLWLAQTPQVFRVDLLRQAYAKHRGRPATDDAELVQRIGIDVALVPGSPENLKITYPHDLTIAQAILNIQSQHEHARTRPDR
ncbi:2-C-methyl-D-erythritol 4-phosphate cytidylyltransferase [Roseiconus nitratireducens]|uniref:2-C-methyl-D-erythritol 4-phosphate cytidylyltransferase n=1 Tax=Roseiconus nitratireducens TaxID=2605748 RepID=A0A5M6DDM1_9BACT|nr:2-C-methyl-D-erythritol 4-phosphate cytidylyltransferase [Roseiconus nitratireducens]